MVEGEAIVELDGRRHTARPWNHPGRRWRGTPLHQPRPRGAADPLGVRGTRSNQDVPRHRANRAAVRPVMPFEADRLQRFVASSLHHDRNPPRACRGVGHPAHRGRSAGPWRARAHQGAALGTPVIAGGIEHQTRDKGRARDGCERPDRRRQRDRPCRRHHGDRESDRTGRAERGGLGGYPAIEPCRCRRGVHRARPGTGAYRPLHGGGGGEQRPTLGWSRAADGHKPAGGGDPPPAPRSHSSSTSPPRWRPTGVSERKPWRASRCQRAGWWGSTASR